MGFKVKTARTYPVLVTLALTTKKHWGAAFGFVMMCWSATTTHHSFALAVLAAFTLLLAVETTKMRHWLDGVLAEREGQ